MRRREGGGGNSQSHQELSNWTLLLITAPTQTPLRPTADLWSGPTSGRGIETGDSGQLYLKQEVILIYTGSALLYQLTSDLKT